MDERHQPAGERWAQLTEVGRITLQSGEGGVRVGLPEERDASGEALVEHQPQRVQVGPPVEALTAYLLRRQVLRRAHHHVVAGEIVIPAVETLGDSEIGEQHPAVGGEEDVARLHVAVDEPGPMGSVERSGDARPDVDRQLGAQPRLDVEDLAQTLAVDQLHHHRLASLVLEGVVDGDDVGVVEPGDGNRLATEPFGDDDVGGERGFEPLHGDPPVESDIGGEPYFRHPALTEPSLETVSIGEHGGLVGARLITHLRC